MPNRLIDDHFHDVLARLKILACWNTNFGDPETKYICMKNTAYIEHTF